MRIAVPHVSFNAAVPASTEWPHPPGRELAEHLLRTVVGIGASGGDIENWRDVGWAFRVVHREKPFDIHFAGPEPAWLIAIEPLDQPGYFKRLFGAKLVPVGAELREISAAIHRGIVQLPDVRNTSWCLNANPMQHREASSPDELQWSA